VDDLSLAPLSTLTQFMYDRPVKLQNLKKRVMMQRKSKPFISRHKSVDAETFEKIRMARRQSAPFIYFSDQT
jgi:hypothetical protein